MELKPTSGDTDISSLQKKNKSKGLGSVNLSSGQQKILKVILLILAVILVLGLTAKVSYNKGYDSGKEAGRKEAPTTGNILNNISNPFQSVVGKVSEIKDNKLTVDTVKGEKKTVLITDKTKITKKRTTLKTSDLKEKQNVTVFTQGSGDDQKATRIVVRD